MVFYFTAVDSSSDDDDFGLSDPVSRVIYMGRDKFENVPLIKHSHPKNLWFHVDNYSSAHVYLQTTNDEQLTNFDSLQISESLLQQLGQFTKANSIKANKVNNITIIYTPVDNLHTDGSMDDGTVTFKNPKKVKKVFIKSKENSIVNKINKTKSEKSTDDFIKEQTGLIQKYHSDKKSRQREQENQERILAKQYQEQRVKNSDPYADLFTEENVRMNDPAYRDEGWNDDDFM